MRFLPLFDHSLLSLKVGEEDMLGGKVPRTEEALDPTAIRSRSQPDTEGTEDDHESSGEIDQGSLTCTSINPIFAVTSPRVRVVCVKRGVESFEKLFGVADASTYQALEEVWRAVEVPSEQYWGCSYADLNGQPQRSEAASPASRSTLPRAPDPFSLQNSFYGSRLEAITSGGYQTNQYQVVVAIDRTHGNESKLFNIFSRYTKDILAHVANKRTSDGGRLGESSNDANAVAAHRERLELSSSDLVSFASSIPCLHNRNLYVLVDEDAAVDPFFDIDWSYTSTESATFLASYPWWSQVEGGPDGTHAFSNIHVEGALFEIINFLKTYIEARLHTEVAQCLVLSSSVQVVRKSPESSTERGCLLRIKLSFHVHFRLHRQQTLANIKELHKLMGSLQRTLDKVIEEGKSQNSTNLTVEGFQVDIGVLQLVRCCVDFSVYSRWRAFRLPYNVKSPLSSPNGPFTVVNAAGDDLMISQLREQLGVGAFNRAAVEVGAAAKSVLNTIELSCDPSIFQKQHTLVRKLLFLFRFLLPIIPGTTELSHVRLKELLEPLAPRMDSCAGTDAHTQNRQQTRFAATVIDLACIQRDNPDLEGAPLHLLNAPSEDNKEAPKGKLTAKESPFSIPIPPRPHSSRIIVQCPRTKALLAEVFACLSPYYNDNRWTPSLLEDKAKNAPDASITLFPSDIRPSRITADRITAQYEDPIRAYYVFQKQSKYCLKLNREHRSTYTQLYLTYGSIKLRCHSNDCYQRCLFVSWSRPNSENVQNDLSHPPGYPKYQRLLEIRGELFPSLPIVELVKRYGPGTLKQFERNATHD